MSNKTQRAADAKIVSGHSWKIAVVLAVAVFLLLLGRQTNQKHNLVLGGKALYYELADSNSSRERGLSGRNNLVANHAMLFVFQDDNEHCFWMKDMKFPLDMIWLNSEKQVVYIKENAQPDSYPQSFCPGQSTRYVLEVNAGTVQADKIQIGNQAKF